MQLTSTKAQMPKNALTCFFSKDLPTTSWFDFDLLSLTLLGSLSAFEIIFVVTVFPQEVFFLFVFVFFFFIVQEEYLPAFLKYLVGLFSLLVLEPVALQEMQNRKRKTISKS